MSKVKGYFQDIKISDGTSYDTMLEAYDIKLVCAMAEIDKLQRELADLILLYELPPEPKSVYEMTYDEYMMLPGKVRL